MAWLDKDFDHEGEEEALRNNPDRLLKKTSGESLEFEAIANNILARGRKGTTKHSELRFYLSPSQLDLRRNREVYPTQGFPEAHIYSGLYRRAHNPQSRGTHSSNSVPGFEEEDH